MNNLKKTISYILLPAMLLFTFRPVLAYAMIKQNLYNMQLTSIQWYIFNGKDVTGTTTESGKSESRNYTYTTYGRGTTLSLEAGGRWPVARGRRPVAGGQWSVAGKGGEQTEILRSNNLSSKIQPCRAEATSVGGNLTQLRQGFRLRKATPGQASGQAFNINTNPFRYSGYYLDALSGLYYLNARYYSSEFMRFTNRDSYDLSNRYAYGNGNPISNVDPGGHSALGWFLAGGCLISAALGIIYTGGLSDAATASLVGRSAMILNYIGLAAGTGSTGLQAASAMTKGKTSSVLDNVSMISGVAGLACGLVGWGLTGYASATLGGNEALGEAGMDFQDASNAPLLQGEAAPDIEPASGASPLTPVPAEGTIDSKESLAVSKCDICFEPITAKQPATSLEHFNTHNGGYNIHEDCLNKARCILRGGGQPVNECPFCRESLPPIGRNVLARYGVAMQGGLIDEPVIATQGGLIRCRWVICGYIGLVVAIGAIFRNGPDVDEGSGG